MNIFESTFEKHKKLMVESMDELKDQQKSQAASPIEKVDQVDSNFKKEFWDDFKEMRVSEFVTKYGQIAKDPKVKAFLTAGLKDSDKDETFRVKRVQTNVMKLVPTQNEIGFKNSLNDLCKISYPKVPEELDRILTGENVILGAPAISEVPIIIFAGRYIIDGHHRWSKVCCANPNARVACLDFNNSLLQNDPERALKAFHLAIAQYQNEMPTEDKSGANLLVSSMDEVYKYVGENLLKPDAAPLMEIYKKHVDKISKSGEITPATVARYIARNAQATLIGKTPATDTPRKFMPQLDKAPAAISSLEAGVINFAPDTKTENKIFESTFNKYKNLYTK